MAKGKTAFAVNRTEIASVCVVVPCYRCTRTIERAIISIVAQTVQPAAVILVDDASDDGTWSLLTDLANAYPGWIKLIHFEVNQGAAAARNAGWEAATQEYIAFLDADDTWHANKIEIQYAYMRTHPEVVLCSHGHREFDRADMAPDWPLSNWAATTIHKWALLLANRFITPSVMIRRDIRPRFCSGRRYMEDRLLWLQIVCDGGRIDKLEIDLAAIYKRLYGAAGLSSHMWEMTKSDVGNYRLLQSRGNLSPLAAFGLMIYSLLKFLRRLAKSFFWRLRDNR